MDIRDIQALRALMSIQDPNELKKALTTTSGFLGYNLEAQAKLMLPLFAGIRNSMPVDTPERGAAAATWRMQLGYGSFDFGGAMGTAFGGNGSATTPSATSISATYASQSVEGEVQFEAIQQARGFDDALRIETAIALSSLIKLDELLNIGGNVAALAVPVDNGSAPSTLSTANTFAAGVWSVFVTAITEQGALKNASGNSNVGESAKSARIDITVGVGDADFLDVAWGAVPGAVGYKVYCNTAVGGGNTTYLCDPATMLKYRKITTGATDLTAFGDAIVVPSGQTFVGVNHVQIYAIPPNTQPTPPGADGSASTIQFDGLFSWCEKTTMYTQSGLTHIKKDMDGAPLTTAGTGISEIDYILENLWNQWVISPTKILTSSKGVTSMGNKIIAANNGNMYRLEMSQERGKLVGGVFVGGYINKFAASLTNQKQTVDVWAHPYVPDGSFLFLCEDVPYQYSQTGKSFALDVQTPYTYWELGRTTRTIPFDVFFTEVLKCYLPNAQAYIAGARVDA